MVTESKKVWEEPTHVKYGDVTEITQKWFQATDGATLGPDADDPTNPPIGTPGAS